MVLELGVTPLHVTQLVAGFFLLDQAGEIQVSVRGARPGLRGRPDAVVRAEIDGARLVFELRDGLDLSAEDLAWCTTYFKRSYRSDVHGADDRIEPLGLNYVVSAGGDWRLRQAGWAALGRRPRSPAALRASLVDAWQLARSQPRVEEFEAPWVPSERPTAMLVTRVWDPRRVDGAKAAHWEELNEVRAGCVRALSSALGDRFTGGLTPTAWAIERYPDLVLDRAATERRRYLEQMKRTDVCVVTRGLRDSNGWRIAECLAASRALASEPLGHEVPGDLGDGRGLAAFTGVDGCVAVVAALLADEDRRRELAVAGRAYYERHVRPDALVRHALARAR